jgi:hypothetical protein
MSLVMCLYINFLNSYFGVKKMSSSILDNVMFVF